MRIALPFAVALLACACAPSVRAGGGPEGVTLRVEPEAVAAGGRVTLVLRNASPDTVGYNLCTSTLQRESGDEWITVPSDRFCTLELRLLAPGAEARYPMELPAGLAPGAYRYSASVDLLDRNAQAEVHSGPFRVTG